ncbi:MAG: choice-of-anchor D domain-containing protein, partial [Candidatus Kapaibacterium sp.]
SADGSNGTAGINQADAGGGGGAGGGLLLSARLGITVGSSTISVDSGLGGLGGAGAQQSSKGGGGGIGRIRIDGEMHFSDSNLSISGIQNFGPTLSIPSGKLSGPFATVGGLAGDSASLTDSIRIYYRNQHSSWSFFDTVRFKINGKYQWQAFLPMGHDASLFVSAMAQVRNPSQSFANIEPQRLLSHLSSGIIKVNATPHLVLQQDTLIFGCYKIGDTCIAANFTIENQGEDSLHITNITIPNANFSVAPTRADLGFYESRNIVITYCPKTVGKETTTIQFVSNDTLRTAVLIGCGIDKDTRITLKPITLDFGKVKVTNCDTLAFTARSIGKDSALFSPDKISKPPFTIIRPKNDTLLAPKDTLHVLVSFCPDDTGDFHSSFIVTEKRDSVVVSGIGTKTSRVLIAESTINGGRLCVGECTTISARFITLGNDTVLISNILGKARFEPNVPVKIPPQTDTLLVIRYCAEGKGEDSISFKYLSDADSVVDSITVLHYYGVHPEFVFDSDLHFPSLCLPSADSLS